MRHHWPLASCHSYQNCTAIYSHLSITPTKFIIPTPSTWVTKEANHVTETHFIISKSKQLLPQSIPILHTPLLAQEIYYLICSLEKSRANAWYPTCAKEIYTFFAIRIYMTLFPMNQISDYWDTRIGTPYHYFTGYMTRDRFQELRMRYRTYQPGIKDIYDRVSCPTSLL